MNESKLVVSGIFLMLLGVGACTETAPADTSHHNGPQGGSPSFGGSTNNTAGTVQGGGTSAGAGATPQTDGAVPDAAVECQQHAFDGALINSIAANGIWVNDFGARHVVSVGNDGPQVTVDDPVGSRGVWMIGEGNDPEVYFILEVGADRFVSAVNSPGNSELPCNYTRIDYVLATAGDAGLDASADGGSSSVLYVCETTHAAESALEAWETRTADPDDLDNGCNGGPWELLREAAE